MSIVQITMYAVRCDHPGCEKQDSTDDYVAWLTPQQANDVATSDAGWLAVAAPEGPHYCDLHLAWCEQCDEQRPILEMVQDPSDGSWYCKSHIKEETPSGV